MFALVFNEQKGTKGSSIKKSNKPMRSLSQKAPRAAMSVAPGSDSMNNGTVLPPVGFESFFFKAKCFKFILNALFR